MVSNKQPKVAFFKLKTHIFSKFKLSDHQYLVVKPIIEKCKKKVTVKIGYWTMVRVNDIILNIKIIFFKRAL